MPFWDIKSKSFRFIINNFIGSFLANPLEQKQIVFRNDKITILDVYLKIEKLNAMLTEKNIPIAVCVAYAAELIINFPLNIEINGLDLVIQTTPYNFSQQSDVMINSLISNMTALAVAAVSVAENEESREEEQQKCVKSPRFSWELNTDKDDEEEEIPFGPQVEKIVEKLDSFVQKLEQSSCETQSLFDESAIERASRFVDSLIAGANVTFRDLQLRLQVPITLSGVHRACDLRLRIYFLELANIDESASRGEETGVSSSTGHQKRQRPKSSARKLSRSGENENGSGGVWSWLWANGWTSPSSRPASRSNDADNLVVSSASPNSIPTLLKKRIILEDATVHWDLWDTNEGLGDEFPLSTSSSCHSSCESSCENSAAISFPVSFCEKNFFSGPTTESMVASACLLALPTAQNYVRICMRDSFFLSQMMTSTTLSTTEKTSTPTNHHEPTGGSTLVDVSIDFGPLVVCACPSEIFWLQLMLRQLTLLAEAYSADRNRTSDAKYDSRDQLISWPKAEKAGCGNLGQTSSENINTQFVELDLSSSPTESIPIPVLTSMIDSRMFRTCMATSEYCDAEEIPSTIETSLQMLPFSFSGHCRFFSLLLLHSDEVAATTVALVPREPSSVSSVHSSLSSSYRRSSREETPTTHEDDDDDDFHEALSSIPSASPPSSAVQREFDNGSSPAALGSINAFFARMREVILLDENGCLVISHAKKSTGKLGITAEDESSWVQNISTEISKLAEPRCHLCLTIGSCQVEVSSYESNGPEAVTAVRTMAKAHAPIPSSDLHGAATSMPFSQRFQVAGQVGGLLLTECLFKTTEPDSKNCSPKITNILSFCEPKGSMVPAVRAQLLPTTTTTAQTTLSEEPLDSSIQIQLGSCNLEVDPSLPDRLHRLVDAMIAGQQTSNQIVVVNSDSTSSPSFQGDNERLDKETKLLNGDTAAGVQTWLTAGNRKMGERRGRDSLANDETLCASDQVNFFQHCASRGLRGHRVSAVNNNKSPSSCIPSLELLCSSLTLTLRVPVPLASVTTLPGEDLTSMRARLWSSSNTGSNPAWWQSTLRRESLAFRLKSICLLTCPLSTKSSTSAVHETQHPTSSRQQVHHKRRLSSILLDPTGTHQKRLLVSGDQALELSFQQLEGFIVEPDVDSVPLVRLLDRSNAGRPRIFLRIAPPGRQHLSDPCLFPESSKYQTAQSKHLRVRIEGDEREKARPSASASTTVKRTDEDEGEMLLFNLSPKDDRRTPFVFKKTFLQDDDQQEWDGETLCPGDSSHMAVYRSAAAQNSRFFVDVSLPIAVMSIPNEKTVALLYTRVFHDLLLCQSLLPSDRRTRALLVWGGGEQIIPAADHRYWFLSEPVPHTTVYALPLAARVAAEREAQMSPGGGFGFHFRRKLFSHRRGDGNDSDESQEDSSPGHQCGGGHLIGSDVDPNEDDEEQDDDDNDDGLRLQISHQSKLFIQVSAEHFEFKVRLPTTTTTPATMPQAVLTARIISFNTELAPSGQSDLVYNSLEVHQIDLHVSDVFSNKPTGTDASFPSRNVVPLIYLLSASLTKQPTHHQDEQEPMLSLAVEKRVLHLKDLQSDTFEEISLAVNLNRTCLILWPKLDDMTGQPCWLQRIASSLTSNCSNIETDYPSFVPVPYSLRIHAHLIDTGLTWSPVSAFSQDAGLTPSPSPSLLDLRPLLVLGQLACFGKFADQQPASSSVVAFLQKMAIFLVQPQSSQSLKKKMQSSGKRKQTQPQPNMMTSRLSGSRQSLHNMMPTTSTSNPSSLISPSQAVTGEVKCLLAWLDELDFHCLSSAAVKVLDLDSLDLRVILEPLRPVPSDPFLSVLPLDFTVTELTSTEPNRYQVDIRVTNNLLRIYTCVDSLVALRMILTSSLTFCNDSSSTYIQPSTATCIPRSRPRKEVADYSTSTPIVVSPRPVSAPVDVSLARFSDDGDNILDASRRLYPDLRALINDTTIESMLSDAISDFESPPMPRELPIMKPSPPPPTTTVVISPPCSPGSLRQATVSCSSDEFILVDAFSANKRLISEESTSLPSDSGAVIKSSLQTTVLCPQEGFYACEKAKIARSSPHHSDRLSLFMDPVGIRTLFSFTLHDFSTEWIFYAGLDFPALNPDEKEDLNKPFVTPPPRTTPGRLKTAGSSDSLGHLSSQEHQFCEEVNTSLRGRQLDQAVLVRLSNIYFRKSIFHRTITPSQQRTPSPCESLNLSSSSLASITTIGIPIGAGSNGAVGDDPMTRYVLRIGDLRVVDRIATSRVNNALHAQRHSEWGTGVCEDASGGSTEVVRASATVWRAAPSLIPHRTSAEFAKELEAEAKISIQPLQVNLDQNMFIFLRTFHDTLSSLMDHCLAEEKQRVPVFDFAFSSSSNLLGVDLNSTLLTKFPNTIFDNDEEYELDDVENDEIIFIRKLVFSPALSIRFNYNGSQLDLSQGTFYGLMALLLQLNNAELVLPRRVYHRGYRGLTSLIDEVLTDWTNVMQSQLPQMLITSLGPMHEVTNIVHGFWDLIFNSIDGFRRHPSDSILTRLGNRDAYMCARCRCVLPPAIAVQSGMTLPTTSVRCRCASLGLLPSLIVISPDRVLRGLRYGARSFSSSALWSTLELSAQGVRAVQSLFETAFDILTPGPSIRHRHSRLRQPADLREGLTNAMYAVTRGVIHITSDLCGAVDTPTGLHVGVRGSSAIHKGSVGTIGDVLRQIPPAMVTPLVIGCEATANILGGLRNQLRPDAKREDEEKWKDTHGL